MASIISTVCCRNNSLRRFKGFKRLLFSQFCTNIDSSTFNDTDNGDNNSEQEIYKRHQILERNKRSQGKRSYRPNHVDPATTTVLLFPGQGSQFVGMGRKTLSFEGASGLYERASDILGYDLLSLCLNGPQEELDKTKYCQPAVMVTSMAAICKMVGENPEIMETVVGMAGFSLGEITAHVCSGSIKFEDAVYLVKMRAKVMQKASEDMPSGMLTVKETAATKLGLAMKAAETYCKQRCNINQPVCVVANYLCPGYKVIAGHEEALQFMQKYGAEWGIKGSKRLPVSGAFHTSLMKSSRTQNFKTALDNVEISEPKCAVHSNIDGKIHTKPDDIRRNLLRHLFRPVKWEQTLHALYERKLGTSFPNTIELGPKKQLGTFLQRTNLTAYKQYKNIEV